MPDSVVPAGINLGQLDPAQFHRIILDNIADGVYYVDRDRKIWFWNHASERLTGFESAQVMGTRCADNILKHVDCDGKNLCENACPLSATMDDGQDREAHVFLHHTDGHRVPVCVRTAVLRDAQEKVVGAVETFSDDTTHMADLLRIRQLEEVAFLDVLTALANRRYIQDRLEAHLAEAQRHGDRFGVIAIDVDNLKTINDRYGHDAGDKILGMVAQTIAHNCRPYDIAGRWGGDEFLVIVGHAMDWELRRLAERLRLLVGQSSLSTESRELSVTLSIGATSHRTDEDLEQLLKRADDLLYRSKTAGRNRVTFEL